MAFKKIQKMFYFSNESNKNFIESRVGDMAKKEQRSESFIIEKLLLDGLLPENEEAKSIIKNYLYADNETSGVKLTLEALFSSNAAGTNWNSKHDNFKQIVEFATDKMLEKIQLNEGDRLYFLSQLNDVTQRIDDCTIACIEPIDRKMYRAQLEKAKILGNLIKDKDVVISNSVTKDLFRLVYDCWEMLDDWTYTYRYLYALSKMCYFKEDAETKIELCSIIDEISKEW